MRRSYVDETIVWSCLAFSILAAEIALQWERRRDAEGAACSREGGAGGWEAGGWEIDSRAEVAELS